jgi:HEAT repeat protein
MTRTKASSIICLAALAALAVMPAVRADDEQRPAAAAGPEKKRPVWLNLLARGYVQAQRQQQPILVRLGSETSPASRELTKNLESPLLQDELKRWTLVEIDVEKSPGDARLMAMRQVPALRVLAPGGRVVALHDGTLPAGDLLDWLKENYEQAVAIPPDDVEGEEPLDQTAVTRLIPALRNREASVREAVIRRLLPHPEVAAGPVVEAFNDGALATRLAALELLRAWKAPAQELDPWRRETLTDERLKALARWSASAGRGPDEAPRDLSAAELAEARETIDRLASGAANEGRALRERLARHGRLLLPEVYERLKDAADEEARERLTALRYRLVESESLARNWPGGIERLAASDAETRMRAADDLAGRAVQADEALLIELFSDPAPLVRELSLRALMRAGGSNANSALLRLLDDPEPNVRTAVLKQLGEGPEGDSEAPMPMHRAMRQSADPARAAIAVRLSRYVETENDPDLVVHAVRVLREIGGSAASNALMSLLSHESWRVRAEAAEGLGKKVDQYSQLPEEQKADIYTAMLGLLEDPDGFVISRAVAVLKSADLLAAVEPLAAAAEAHPELAAEVIQALSNGNNQKSRAVPKLRKLAGHADARIRAAAIGGLCARPGADMADDLRAALKDDSRDVRVAAANGFFGILTNRRQSDSNNISQGTYRNVETVPEAEDDPPAADAEGVPVLPLPAPRPLGPVAPADDGEPVPPAPAPKPAAAQRTGLSDFFDAVKSIFAPTTGETVMSDQISEPPQPEESSFGNRDRAEEWLGVIRGGKYFPKWQREMRAVLEPLLASPDSQERLAAVLPLAALGADELAIAEIIGQIEADPKSTAKLSAALPWLRADGRDKVLRKMLERTASSDDLAIIAHALSEVRSPRAEAALWTLISHPAATLASAETVKSSLMITYFPNHYYNLNQAPARDRKRAVAAATTRARADGHRLRLVGLAMLISLEPETAVEIAQKLLADERTQDDERTDALRVVLLALPEVEAVRAAIGHLASSSPPRQQAALAYLTADMHRLQSLGDGAFVLSADQYARYGAGSTAVAVGEPIVPEPPAGLVAEPLLPLLSAEDPRTAAQAGYLVALLGREEGLRPLMSFWQTRAVSDPGWMRMVYRAIASLNDGSQAAVLREIYNRLHNEENDQYLSEFYWTIRSMTAAEILPLRKTIRDEVGLEQLRRSATAPTPY